MEGVATANLGVSASREGRYEEALRFHREGLAIVREVNNRYTEMQGLNEMGETYQELKKWDEALEAHLEAIAKQIQKEKKKPQGRQDKTNLAILSNTLATTEGEFNQWMLKLKFQNRKMYDALTIKPTTPGDIQNEIPGGALILEYFVSSDQLYVFCIGRNYFFAKSVSISEDELTKLVHGYSRLVQDPYSPRKRVLKQNAVKLYDILVRPVESIMKPYDNIVVAPFGVLYYVPFHALIRSRWMLTVSLPDHN